MIQIVYECMRSVSVLVFKFIYVLELLAKSADVQVKKEKIGFNSSSEYNNLHTVKKKISIN